MKSKRRPRRHISRLTELAAALCQLVDSNGERLVSHELAKQKTARQITKLFDRDHYPIAVADGGLDLHWNITWRLKADHRRKTGTDVRQFAKDRRLQAAEMEHKRKMLVKGKRKKRRRKSTWALLRRPQKYVWPSRKLQSRGFTTAR